MPRNWRRLDYLSLGVVLNNHVHPYALEHQLQAILFFFHGVVGRYLALLIANAISAAGHPAGDSSRSVYGEG